MATFTRIVYDPLVFDCGSLEKPRDVRKVRSVRGPRTASSNRPTK